MKLATPMTGLLLTIASMLQACGGGGGGAGGGGAGGGGNPGGPPAGPNQPPVAGNPIPDQRFVVAHPVNFDVSQGGRSFTDPNGDPLSYEVTFDNPPPPGLASSGNLISGAPTAAGAFGVTAIARDGRGGEVSARFLINIDANRPPVATGSFPDRLLSATDFVDIEATQGGTLFSDADGDPITYEVRFAGSAHGLTIVGTRVTGIMNSIGLVRVSIIARDGFGGVGETGFSLARAGPEPGLPTLPAPSYVYADEELGLPCQYEVSRQIGIPFPDTTPPHNPTTNAGATLGRVLFYDKRLSITNTVACGTCHQQQNGFAVNERFSVGAQGTPQTRNAMSLGNVRYSKVNDFFWDERIRTLETLVPIPIQNPVELGQPMLMLEAKLAATAFYPPLFQAAFGSPEVTSDRISRALAQFLRSLITYRSKFDDAFLVLGSCAIADISLVFSPQELRGHQIATDSQCFSCHDNLVLIVEAARNNGLDRAFADPGAGGGRFGPPSLKNIRVTGPYMHDGRFATLREVIDFYDQGVQDSPDLDLIMREHQSGPPRRLNLSAADKDALEAFLDTLTDQQFLNDPRFSDPFE